MDRIALALSCENTKHHEYPTHIAEVARATRWAAIEKAVALHRHSSFDLWIIHAYPTDFDMARYRRIQAAVVEMKETPEVLMERARAERPPRMVEELRRRIAGTD
jgi:hypothetical protein